jgi:hypothetical protein
MKLFKSVARKAVKQPVRLGVRHGRKLVTGGIGGGGSKPSKIRNRRGTVPARKPAAGKTKRTNIIRESAARKPSRVTVRSTDRVPF